MVFLFLIKGVTCGGTGHAIYKGHLYCNRANTNKIVKIDIITETIVQETVLQDASSEDDYAYDWGGLSNIDFALDDNDVMYVIYGSFSRAGIMAVSKLDMDSLSILQTWYTSINKNKVGNAFIVKGVLYMLNSHSKPTYISYFDTNTNGNTTLRVTDIPYNGPSNGYLTQLAYMPGTGLLYVWDNGLLQKVPLRFNSSGKAS
ncbi:unnamed protein product, partial [Owenia fusiformis]